MTDDREICIICGHIIGGCYVSYNKIEEKQILEVFVCNRCATIICRDVIER